MLKAVKMENNFLFLTLFPQIIHSYFQFSIAKRALLKKLFSYKVYNLRDFSIKGQVDDYIYGGGSGMLIKIDCLVRALTSIREIYRNSHIIILSPQGKIFKQKDVERLLRKSPNLIFVCGHYEGFDSRINNYVFKEKIEQLSLGKFISSGGEIPSLLIIDSLIRGIPGVIKKESYLNDSFTNNNKLDFDSYTRPLSFDGLTVPKILISGNHQKIHEWRKENSSNKTKKEIKYDQKKLPNPNQWRLIINKIIIK